MTFASPREDAREAVRTASDPGRAKERREPRGALAREPRADRSRPPRPVPRRAKSSGARADGVRIADNSAIVMKGTTATTTGASIFSPPFPSTREGAFRFRRDRLSPYPPFFRQWWCPPTPRFASDAHEPLPRLVRRPADRACRDVEEHARPQPPPERRPPLLPHHAAHARREIRRPVRVRPARKKSESSLGENAAAGTDAGRRTRPRPRRHHLRRRLRVRGAAAVVTPLIAPGPGPPAAAAAAHGVARHCAHRRPGRRRKRRRIPRGGNEGVPAARRTGRDSVS